QVDTETSPSPESGLLESDRQSLEQRADAGDAKAQHDLALAYLTGAVGTESPERAAELLREAAIQGLPGAQYNLAVLYETGQGVRQDDVRALLWYHSAAEQGHPNAQYNLGVMYAEGRGIPLNFGEAARWFQAAAKQGMARALYNLAVMTDEGLGVVQDKKKALALFSAAADAGDQRAIEMLSGSGETAGQGASPLNSADGVRSTTDVPAAIVANVQRELARIGLYSSSVDGLMGPKTRAAIRSFEQSVGLDESGEATEALLEKLRAAKP
ncbi:MAG: SEL1-like repeat protein, partial [Nitratireductor sp.]